MELSYSRKKESYKSIFLALRNDGYCCDFEVNHKDLQAFISAFCDVYDIENDRVLFSILQDENVRYFNIAFGDPDTTELTIYYKNCNPVFKSYYLDDIENLK